MKNARQLLEEFIALSFRDPESASSMFTEDGAFEMPYLADLGLKPVYQGRQEIAGFFKFVRELYPGLQLGNLRIRIETPDRVFSEYEFSATSSKTGRFVHQLFFGLIVAERGQVKLIREALDTAGTIRAIFPNGFADVPAGAPLSNSPKS